MTIYNTLELAFSSAVKDRRVMKDTSLANSVSRMINHSHIKFYVLTTQEAKRSKDMPLDLRTGFAKHGAKIRHNDRSGLRHRGSRRGEGDRKRREVKAFKIDVNEESIREIEITVISTVAGQLRPLSVSAF